MQKRVFSGIQPTGQGHIGNYLGAIRNWVRQQDEYDAFFCIVDLHAMTMPWEPDVLRRETIQKTAELLACGIDPERCVLFVQSHVVEHTELQWVLTCVARMGELRRMVQFKDRSKGETESVGVGLFSYPVLQAADVLLYQAHGVPVGEDQRQHIELMRDLAQRFNSNFGVTFTLPEPWIPEVGARIMALDDPTQKMSKSDMETRPASGLLLTEDPKSLTKKIKSAKTDSGAEVKAGDDKPELTNLLGIYAAVEGVPVSELEDRFAGKGYGDFKGALAEVVVAAFEPIRLRYEELMSDPGEIDRMLLVGAEKAAEVAAKTMDDVRIKTGLGPKPVLSRR